MDFHSRFATDFLCILHELQRELKGLGREGVLIGQLHIDVMRAVVGVFFEKFVEFLGVARGDIANDDEAVFVGQFFELRCGCRCKAVESGLLDGADFFFPRTIRFWRLGIGRATTWPRSCEVWEGFLFSLVFASVGESEFGDAGLVEVAETFSHHAVVLLFGCLGEREIETLLMGEGEGDAAVFRRVGA